MKELNEMIKAIKDTYFDMIATCEIQIKQAKGLRELAALENLKASCKVKIAELDLLLTT